MKSIHRKSHRVKWYSPNQIRANACGLRKGSIRFYPIRPITLEFHYTVIPSSFSCTLNIACVCVCVLYMMQGPGKINFITPYLFVCIYYIENVTASLVLFPFFIQYDSWLHAYKSDRAIDGGLLFTLTVGMAFSNQHHNCVLKKLYDPKKCARVCVYAERHTK